MAKTKKRKLSIKKIVRFIVFILVVVGGIFTYIYINHQNELKEIRAKEERERKIAEQKALEAKQKKEYEECVVQKYNAETEVSETLTQKKQEIDDLIKNKRYRTSVKYEDIQTGFSYEYDSDKVYYGCSLIKIVDALYLIDKASKGEIDLDKETVKYTSRYVKAFSSKMSKRKLGEDVSLKDLISYAVEVSDNSAHIMLIDYIGLNTLKEYGKSLGGKVILQGGDKFGNQTPEDTNIYLKKVYEVITTNETYGPWLKELMDNDDRNAFNTGDLRIYHKYGATGANFHDIGLNLTNENPYAISVFTLHEDGIYKEVVQGINAKVIELHNTFWKERKDNCHKKVYGN